MYERQWYLAISKKLKEEDTNQVLRGSYVVIPLVELACLVIERLQLENVSVFVLWFVLSGLCPQSFYEQLSEQQMTFLARARILLPFSGRFAWEAAIRQYMRVPYTWRAYDIKVWRLQRTENQKSRFSLYEKSLTDPVADRLQSLKFATDGEKVYFETYRASGVAKIPFEISSVVAAFGKRPIPWFTTPRERKPVTFERKDFAQAAQKMYDIEKQREHLHGLKVTNWPDLLTRVHFRAVRSDGSLNLADDQPLILNGFTSIPGMVGSGKTISSRMIAFMAAQRNLRITLVVGDVMTALEAAAYFNKLLVQKQDDHPVAVTLLGHTTRDKHLRLIYNAKSFLSNGDHYMLRILNTACLLQSQWPGSLPETLKVGKEPCQYLLVPAKEKQEDERRSRYKGLSQPEKRACPLLSVCPMHQMFRDMPTASIWVTTPGALGSVTIPAQIDARNMKLWEIIYEQSDIVSFDEADAIQNWFDQVCAPSVLLTYQNGQLDLIDERVSEAWAFQRALEPHRLRWVHSVRHSTDAMSHMLSQLDYYKRLSQWVDHKYFTARSLLFSLACYLSGVPEPQYDEEADAGEQSTAFFPQRHMRTVSATFQKVMKYFDQVLECDVQFINKPMQGEKDPVYRLIEIREHILVRGEQLDECKEWIQIFVPRIDDTLAILSARAAQDSQKQKSRRKRKNITPDDLESLALCLDFALSVVTLDRNMQVVLDEWHNGLTGDLGDYRLERSPIHLSGLLPTPPMGKLIGFYYRHEGNTGTAPEDPEPQKIQRLEIFEYSLIGRVFMTEFYHLRALVDGRSGPHVIALSGTSWLPDSSRFHINVDPKAILEPEEKACRAIARSHFTFLPQYEDTKKGCEPIAVSGTRKMNTQLKKIAAKLADGEFSPLRVELDSIEKRILLPDGDVWKDRKRLLLLVNSYDQVEVVAQEIARRRGWADLVYGLRRGSDGEDYWLAASRWYEAWRLSDVEEFGQTKGEVLVAPIEAIGRGYNILNENAVAAFGAVYFLTRPMPHPFDAQSQASEMNALALKWQMDTNFSAWKEKDLYQMGLAMRREANNWWQKTEYRYGYQSLPWEQKKDLASSTAGVIIQTCGRLLRGGVPFDAFFVDAAWGPRNAPGTLSNKTPLKERDDPTMSLLAAIIYVLDEYSKKPIGHALYDSLAQAIREIDNFYYSLDVKIRSKGKNRKSSHGSNA